MIGNILTQYVCIRAIFYLTTVCTSLTVTLVVTLRKFLSLVLSVWYFNNDFTGMHYCGALFVFVGTLLYAEVFTSRSSAVKKAAGDAAANGLISLQSKNKVE